MKHEESIVLAQLWPFSSFQLQWTVGCCTLLGCGWRQDTTAAPRPQTPNRERGSPGFPQVAAHTNTEEHTHAFETHTVITRCTQGWLKVKNAIQNPLTSLASPAFCLIISNGHSLQSKIFLRSLKWESSVKLRHVLLIFKQNNDFISWVKSKSNRELSVCVCVRVRDWPGYSSSVQEAPRLCVPAHSVLRRLRLVAEISVLQGESQLQTEV